jgi:hypothetical protein
VTFLICLILSLQLPAWSVPIAVASISGIDFGVAPQGDASKTVIPNTIETSTNGSMQISGDLNRVYSIILPASPIDITTTAPGGGPKTISVSLFTSFPTPASGGQLNASGTQMLYIGATRAALSAIQTPGAYSGTFIITVIY